MARHIRSQAAHIEPGIECLPAPPDSISLCCCLLLKSNKHTCFAQADLVVWLARPHMLTQELPGKLLDLHGMCTEQPM